MIALIAIAIIAMVFFGDRIPPGATVPSSVPFEFEFEGYNWRCDANLIGSDEPDLDFSDGSVGIKSGSQGKGVFSCSASGRVIVGDELRIVSSAGLENECGISISCATTNFNAEGLDFVNVVLGSKVVIGGDGHCEAQVDRMGIKRGLSCPNRPISDSLSFTDVSARQVGDRWIVFDSINQVGSNLNQLGFGVISHHKGGRTTTNAEITIRDIVVQESLEEQVNLLTLTLGEKLAYINSLNLNIDEKTALIEGLELSIADKVSIIKSLNLTLTQKADFIKNLNATIQLKAIIIKDLEAVQSRQVEIIDLLDLKIDEQAEMIGELTVLINEQADMINQLASNLEEKAALVGLLQAETVHQAQLIKEMELSFTKQGEIISLLDTTIEEDAQIINALTSNIENQAEIITSLKRTQEEKEDLIVQLKTSLEEEQQLTNLFREQLEQKNKSLQITIIVVAVLAILILALVFSRK